VVIARDESAAERPRVSRVQRQIFRDPELQRRFVRQGFVVVPCLTKRQVAALRETWQDFTVPVHALGFSASIMSADPAYRSAVDEATGAAFASVLRELLAGYRFSFGNYVTKRAATGLMGVHQDPTFIDERYYEGLNVWVPLQDVTSRNGCLRVVPGSHDLNLALRGTDRRFPYPQLLDLIHERYLQDVPLRSGWACITSQRTFHGSHANATDEDRVCVAAIAVPVEAELLYCYQGRSTGGMIDVYRVDESYYRAHAFGSPPDDIVPSARMRPAHEIVTPERLAAAYAGAGGTGS
jgi:Phytanoyl-CoA dioxygenase (PhyH)